MSDHHWPFASQYFFHPRCKPYRMHYIDVQPEAGLPIKSTVVMLHGNPTWSYYFRPIIASVKSSHRVIVPDHMGCGLSDKPDTKDYSYCLKQRVDDLYALLSHCGVLRTESPIDLVVHDWGGMIGLHFATRYPQYVRKLVITNTSGFLLPQTTSLPWQLKVAKSPLGKFLIKDLGLFHKGALLMCAKKPLAASVKQMLAMPYQHAKDREAVFRFVEDIPLDQSHPSFQEVYETQQRLPLLNDHPKLILWGGQDFVFNEHFLAAFRAVWPTAKVHLFPEAGHYLFEDEPEETARLISTFLAS